MENSAVAAALEKLRSHHEPEAGFMKTRQGMVPAYNVQTAVDAEHGLTVAQQVTDEANDTRSLLPMAEAAQQAVGQPSPSDFMALPRPVPAKDAGTRTGHPLE